jgi:hypothetical protein
MPSFEFTSPEGKTYTVAGPDGATKEQAFAMLQTQLKAKPQSLADQIPGSSPIPQAAPEQEDTSILGRVRKSMDAVIEPALAMGTGAVAGVVGPWAGIGKSVVKGLTGKYATPEEARRDADNTAADVSQALTYQPRSRAGQAITQGIGHVLDRSGVIGVAPMAGELSALGRAAAPVVDSAKIAGGAVADAGIDAAQSGLGSLRDVLRKPDQQMTGMGAATTEESTLRAQRAANLPVPMTLTKGQRERTFEQQRFERETAKLPKEGDPLRQRFADQNEQMQQNLDAFREQTGAESPDLRTTGNVVTKALENRVADIKGKIRESYSAAEKAGHMNELVDMGPLVDYLDKNQSSLKMAPILGSIRSEINRLGVKGKPLLNASATGLEPSSIEMSINNAEKLRQMINDLAEPGTPNFVKGIEAKKLIDSATEGKGGELYQQARRQFENYSKQFTDRDVIDKMLRNKPGTRDRAVAYEDVFDHSIMKGSLDDVRAVRRTLQTSGEEGNKAWQELQGQTVQHIKDAVTANSARDIRGNPIVSPDKLNKLVSSLDADGKLDFIFGKQGAQQIRDVNDLAKDVYTSPPGAVNSSNTATVLAGLLDTAVSGMTGTPLPVASALNYTVKRVKSNALQKKVSAALNPDSQPKQNALSRALSRSK